MKFTLAWLKDHLDTSASLAELTAKLSALGLEVEGVEDRGATLKAFSIARVLEAKPHPNADKLQVCKVETGAGIVEVVCGAPNARTGMIGVFAPVGSYIPGKALTLEARAVRGIVSAGMLVSEAELQLSEEGSGIIELPAEMGERIGQPFADAMGFADPVIEVKLTPNRPDCTGVRGIARDLAAAGLGTLKAEPKLCWRRRRVSLPDRDQARVSRRSGRRLSLFRGPVPQGCQRRPGAGLDAATAQRGWPAADQCAGRRDQLRQSRPGTAAARL